MVYNGRGREGGREGGGEKEEWFIMGIIVCSHKGNLDDMLVGGDGEP